MARSLPDLAQAGLIDAGWARALEPVGPDIAALGDRLRAEVAAGRRYLPAGDHVLRAFQRPLADVRVLARGLRAFFEHGDEALLDDYSDRCLRRVWRVQHFSWFMTQLLHRTGGDPFEARLQRAQLDYVVRSRAAATSLAENYVGLELEDA